MHLHVQTLKSVTADANRLITVTVYVNIYGMLLSSKVHHRLFLWREIVLMLFCRLYQYFYAIC